MITDVTKLGSNLAEWRGGEAKLWQYSVSHQSLTIRLERPQTRGNLHLHCIGCEYIKAPTFWSNCNIQVKIPDVLEEIRIKYRIEDPSNGIVIDCMGVAVEENADPLY